GAPGSAQAAASSTRTPSPRWISSTAAPSRPAVSSRAGYRSISAASGPRPRTCRQLPPWKGSVKSRATPGGRSPPPSPDPAARRQHVLHAQVVPGLGGGGAALHRVARAVAGVEHGAERQFGGGAPVGGVRGDPGPLPFSGRGGAAGGAGPEPLLAAVELLGPGVLRQRGVRPFRPVQPDGDRAGRVGAEQRGPVHRGARAARPPVDAGPVPGRVRRRRPGLRRSSRS